MPPVYAPISFLSKFLSEMEDKGVSFLKFMLSKEKDVDTFSQRKQQGQQLSTIELYPKGYVPQHHMSKYKKKVRQEQGVNLISASNDTQTTPSKPL